MQSKFNTVCWCYRDNVIGDAMGSNIDKYVSAHSKSQLGGLVITILLGPLGLFYASKGAAIVLCVIAIISATSIIGPIICWVLSILVSVACIAEYNDKVKTTANLISKGD